MSNGINYSMNNTRGVTLKFLIVHSWNTNMKQHTDNRRYLPNGQHRIGTRMPSCSCCSTVVFFQTTNRPPSTFHLPLDGERSHQYLVVFASGHLLASCLRAREVEGESARENDRMRDGECDTHIVRDERVENDKTFSSEWAESRLIPRVKMEVSGDPKSRRYCPQRRGVRLDRRQNFCAFAYNVLPNAGHFTNFGTTRRRTRMRIEGRMRRRRFYAHPSNPWRKKRVAFFRCRGTRACLSIYLYCLCVHYNDVATGGGFRFFSRFHTRRIRHFIVVRRQIPKIPCFVISYVVGNYISYRAISLVKEFQILLQLRFIWYIFRPLLIVLIIHRLFTIK